MSEKFTLMHAEKANHTIGLMARLLEVSRAGYYAWAKRQGTLSPTAARRTWLAEQIRTIHAESNGVNGFRRVLAALARRGISASEGLVRGIMNELGIFGIQPRTSKRTTIAADDEHDRPDLIRRDFTACRPGERLVGDITYLRTGEASLRRLQTDVIDLYQIHWPERHVPAFGNLYYDPAKETSQTPIREQLEALAGLVKAGKVRYIGLSNETPYGVHEFVRLAEQHGLPRVATVQNPYCLINRTWENGLDETCHRLNVSLLAYSPLGFGLLTGKYDESGTTGPNAPQGARIASYESVRKQRWGRPEALAASRRYNQLARDNGMTPTQMALAFCYTKWQVASTIIGVTSVAQLDEDLNAWGTTLSPEVLKAIDAIRWELRDPAL